MNTPYIKQFDAEGKQTNEFKKSYNTPILIGKRDEQRRVDLTQIVKGLIS